MLRIRAELHSALGGSFVVEHDGPLGPVSVTVPVVDAGRDDMTPLPAVFMQSAYGTSEPSNVGGGAAEQFAHVDLLIEAVDSDDVNGWLVLEDIHAVVEERIRAHEASLGDSYFTFATSWRDRPEEADEGDFHIYRRIVTVRAQDLQKY